MPKTNRSIRIFSALLILAGLYGCKAEQAPETTTETVAEAIAWQATDDGVVVDIDHHGFNKLRLQVIDEAIVRVTATPGEDFSNLPDTLMVTAEAVQEGFSVEQAGETVVLKTGAMSAEVALDSGTVRFLDADGKLLLAEAGRSLGPVTADPGEVDIDSLAVRQQFLQAHRRFAVEHPGQQ